MHVSEIRLGVYQMVELISDETLPHFISPPRTSFRHPRAPNPSFPNALAFLDAHPLPVGLHRARERLARILAWRVQPVGSPLQRGGLAGGGVGAGRGVAGACVPGGRVRKPGAGFAARMPAGAGA